MCYLESALLAGKQDHSLVEKLVELYLTYLGEEDVSKLGLSEREKNSSPFAAKWALFHQRAFIQVFACLTIMKLSAANQILVRLCTTISGSD